MPDEATLLASWEKMRAPVPLDALQFRPGSRSRDRGQAMVLAYIDVTYIADLLDRIWGPGNWDRPEPTEVTVGDIPCVKSCLRIRVNDEWLERWEYGYPNTIKDGKALDDEPYKSASSDSLKRCAWLWGIGRELRNGPEIWWPLTQHGRFENPDRLRAEYWKQAQALSGPAPPSQTPTPATAAPAREPHVDGGNGHAGGGNGHAGGGNGRTRPIVHGDPVAAEARRRSGTGEDLMPNLRQLAASRFGVADQANPRKVNYHPDADHCGFRPYLQDHFGVSIMRELPSARHQELLDLLVAEQPGSLYEYRALRPEEGLKMPAGEDRVALEQWIEARVTRDLRSNIRQIAIAWINADDPKPKPRSAMLKSFSRHQLIRFGEYVARSIAAGGSQK